VKESGGSGEEGGGGREQSDRGGASVLDLGCGSALLAMLAARAGASKVYACDKAPGMAACAERVVAANGLHHKITIIPKLSTCMTVGAREGGDMSERATLLVSETFGDDPFSESFLPSLAHAREHLLSKTAAVIPYGLQVQSSM
jgi:type II protein arginine methyltransferase